MYLYQIMRTSIRRLQYIYIYIFGGLWWNFQHHKMTLMCMKALKTPCESIAKKSVFLCLGRMVCGGRMADLPTKCYGQRRSVTHVTEIFCSLPPATHPHVLVRHFLPSFFHLTAAGGDFKISCEWCCWTDTSRDERSRRWGLGWIFQTADALGRPTFSRWTCRRERECYQYQCRCRRMLATLRSAFMEIVNKTAARAG